MKRFWLAPAIVLVAMFLASCSNLWQLPEDKRTYTPEDFMGIVSDAGFGESQSSDYPDDMDHVVSCCTIEDDGVLITYFLFENVTSADLYFFDEKLEMDSTGKESVNTIDNFMNYEIYQQESDTRFEYLIRVDNAVLRISATSENKDKVEAFLLALDY